MGGHGPDFGQLLTDGNYSSGSYRYGFQDQEMDNELKGTGNSINFKYRMHDPRIGRFFAVDPLAFKYPYNSQYAFSENRVIDAVELEGLECGPLNHAIMVKRRQYETALKNGNQEEIEQSLYDLNMMSTLGTVGALSALDFVLTGGILTRLYGKNLATQYGVQVAIEETKNMVSDDDERRSQSEILKDAANKVDFLDSFFSLSNSPAGKFIGVILSSGIDYTPEGFSTIFDGDKEMGQFAYDLIGNAFAESVGLTNGKYGEALSAGIAYFNELIKEGTDEMEALTQTMGHIRETIDLNADDEPNDQQQQEKE